MPIHPADEQDNIVSAIQDLHRNHKYVDFCFISQDGCERFPVHKLVLAIQSRILSELVFGHPKCNEIKVENVGSIALQNMIKHFYSEELIFEDISHIKQTKLLADLYEIYELGEICKSKFIEMQISASNVLSALEVAKELGNVTKQKECLLIIGRNQETVLTSEQFFKLQFECALDVYEKLREMTMMTEYTFLRSAIRWIVINEMLSKKTILMEKVDLRLLSIDEYLNVIEVQPEFFSNIEIANATKTIRHVNGAQNAMLVCGNNKEYTDRGVVTDRNENNKDYTDRGVVTDKNENNEEYTDRNSGPEDLQNVSAQEINGNSVMENQTSNSAQQSGCQKNLSFIENYWPEEPNKLTITILNQDDALNVHKMEKRVKITIQDSISVRSMQIGVTDMLKQGLLCTVIEENKDFVSMNADISYEGLHFMFNCIPTFDLMLTPRQYMKVLKAASVFKFSDLEEQCRVEISSITDYDPLFLDDLMRSPHFKDKCLQLLKSEPFRVMVHPNFIHCSADLVFMLLEQDELKVINESQLLIVIIQWLEAKNRDRRHFRCTILNKLSFENISMSDFMYAIQCYPTFFTSKEQQLISAYRNAVGSEVKYFRDKLPDWYKFKSRKIY